MIPLTFPQPQRLIRLTTQDDFGAIEASMARKEEEMTRLDTKIAKLNYKLASLTKERKLIMEAYPPIHKLSTEVLQEIFILCLPPRKYTVLAAREAPLLLCRVCHSWRQLAHATPQLWSSIHFPLNGSRREGPAPSLDDIKSWLSRSKSLPLSISIIHLPNPDGYFMEPYMEVMASVKNRWKSLHVVSRTAFDTVKYLVDMGNMDELCSLEELYIQSKYRVDHDDNDYSAFELLLKIPKLRSLTIPFDVFIPLWPNVDGTKLTRLGITRPFEGAYTISHVARILSWVPRLQSLSISGFRLRDPFVEWPPGTPPIHLSDLETLSITDYREPLAVWEFLEGLHTPRLRHWRFLLSARYYGDEEELLGPVSNFLSRLHQPLEELDLLLESRGVEFRAFLDLVPNLKRLSLATFFAAEFEFDTRESILGVGDFHFSCLAPDSAHSLGNDIPHPSPNTDGHIDSSWDMTPSYPCPQLEVFRCIYFGESLSRGVLLNFLRQRTGSGAKAKGVTPLKKVGILGGSEISDEWREAVHEILDGTGTQFSMRPGCMH